MAAEGDLEEHEEPYIGVNHNGKLIPSTKEKARIARWMKKQEDDRERKRRQREEHDQAVAEATARAQEKYEESTTISVLGKRVRLKDGVIVDP